MESQEEKNEDELTEGVNNLVKTLGEMVEPLKTLTTQKNEEVEEEKEVEAEEEKREEEVEETKSEEIEEEKEYDAASELKSTIGLLQDLISQVTQLVSKSADMDEEDEKEGDKEDEKEKETEAEEVKSEEAAEEKEQSLEQDAVAVAELDKLELENLELENRLKALT